MVKWDFPPNLIEALRDHFIAKKLKPRAPAKLPSHFQHVKIKSKDVIIFFQTSVHNYSTDSFIVVWK